MTPEDQPNADELLQLGRQAAEARSWAEALAHLQAADALTSLDIADLELLGQTSYMVGREPDMVRTLERAHKRCLEEGDEVRAARNGFWIGLNLALRGRWEEAAGWLGRVQRILEGHDEPSVMIGYLQLPRVIQGMAGGDFESAQAAARRAIEIGRQFGERDLVALAVHAHGRAMTAGGQIEEGLKLLDEAMVAVLADDLTPMVAGIVYCGVIEACHHVHALRRAHRWTEALTRWCDGQQGLVAFTGQCLTHRAELLQLRGDWVSALDEAISAGQRFPEGVNQFPAARAFYRQGELHRLQGALDRAAEAYEATSRYGWTPQPGSALLLLARGDATAALASLTTALAASDTALERARVLPAAVTIALAAGEPAAARRYLEELEAIVVGHATDTLKAIAAQARGEVLIAEQRLPDAVATLTQARSLWAELEAPYETAWARLTMAKACQAMGDAETASREARAAEAVFADLGAHPAADEARRISGTRTDGNAAGLSPRELEVLALVAGGRTNREVAAELVLSERTIDRHVSNILTKLGVSSRTAATAYAYEHDLL